MTRHRGFAAIIETDQRLRSCVRLIPTAIASLEDLGIPPVVTEFGNYAEDWF